nr:hypothetical protein [Bacilli bacterium]
MEKQRYRTISLLTTIFALSTLFVQSGNSLAKTVPANAVHLYQAGLAIMHQNATQALADFTESEKLAPWWEPPVYEQGQILAVTDFQKAIPILMHAAQLAPKDDTVWNILGWGYYTHQEFTQAIQAFTKQLTVNPTQANAHWGLANRYDNSSVRQFAKARQQLQLLLSSSAFRAMAQKSLASLPPNAIDLTYHDSLPISEEDAIAALLSYRRMVYPTSNVLIKGRDGHLPSPEVTNYIAYADQIGLLKGLQISSFQASATRVFLAQLLANFYGINQYDYIRPFQLNDIATLPVATQMTINSILANQLMTTVTPNDFAPLRTMTRSEFASTLQNANRIMKNPPSGDQLVSPEPHLRTSPPFIYFFSTSQPSLSVQSADLTSHQKQISAIGLTYFPFIADFPSGSAKTRQAIDQTQYLLTVASAGGGATQEWQQLEQTSIAPFMVLANYNNVTHQADPAIVDQMLTTPGRPTALINEITAIARKEKLRGVTVDFENILPKDRVPYVNFMQALHAQLSANGITTMVCLPERDQSAPQSPYDYAGLSSHADLVMLITYDEHVPGGKPGTIAALFNDQRVIQYALTQIPANKLLLGVADYGYDWSAGTGVEVSMQQAKSLASSYHATITIDPSSQTPTFQYTDASGVKHTVWFENGQSLTYVDQLVNTFALRGIAVWHLGAEDTSFWHALTTAHLSTS